MALVMSADGEPAPATLEVQALLWLLYQRSDRQRWPFEHFWQTLTRPITGVRAADERRMYLRTNLLAIARALGLDPERLFLENRLRAIVEQFAVAHGPDNRTRLAMVAAVTVAELDREIVACKGQPHSPAARNLIDCRRAAGVPIDGSTARRALDTA